MKFNTFLDKIYLCETINLGGLKSQNKLAPEINLNFPQEEIKKSNPREASVLVLFYEDNNNQTQFLLMKRSSYRGTHSAQISFPGGKREGGESLKETALRETHEEVGLAPYHVKIVRKLTETYIPPSNFLITPFLGFTTTKPNFKLNHEVDSIIEVAVNDLLNTDNFSRVAMETSYMEKIEVPCYILNGNIVWGATAMILSEIKDMLKVTMV